MYWLVLLSFIGVEFYLALVIIKVIACLPRPWLRWMTWALFWIVSSFFLCIGSVGIAQVFVHGWDDNWRAAVSSTAPLPTARLFSLVWGLAFPLMTFTLGAAGLTRARTEPQLPRANAWTFQGTLTGLIAAVVVCVAITIVNDMSIRQRMIALTAATAARARDVAPKACGKKGNAADYYQIDAERRKLLEQRPSSEFPDSLEELRNPTWTAYLSVNAATAEKVRNGANLDCCRFGENWENPSVFADAPELHDLGRCATLLLAEGHRALLDGDDRLGFSNAIALRRMAEHASSDPRAVSQVLAAKCEGCAASLLEHCLFVRRPTGKEVASLIRPGFEFRKALARSFIWQEAEICSGLRDTYLDVTNHGDVAGPRRYPAWLSANPVSRLLFAGDDLAAAPRYLSQMRARAELGYGDATSPEESTNSLMRRTPRGWLERIGLITIRTLPSTMALFGVYYRADAARAAADFAILLTHETDVENLSPADVDAFVPTSQRPIDPFAGEPLHVAVADGGLIIYSVGMNCQDDGGTEDAGATSRGDMAFCLGKAFLRRRRQKSPSDCAGP